MTYFLIMEIKRARNFMHTADATLNLTVGVVLGRPGKPSWRHGANQLVTEGDVKRALPGWGDSGHCNGTWGLQSSTQ